VLLTGGVDGLACVFDVSAAADEEEALAGVLSIGSSVARLGFCGEAACRLWVLTSTEELSLWDWADGARTGAAPDTRALAAAAAAAAAATPLASIDYLIRCEWDAPRGRLWLLAGTQDGAVGAFPIGGDGAVGAPEVCLAGGHADVVRAVEWCPARGDARGALTGGEDSRLCAWGMAAAAGGVAQPAGSGGGGGAGGSGLGPSRRSPSSEGHRYSPY
jgi:hypothetical protein